MARAFMRNDREGILREVQRDLKDALVHNGVNISTAGSINNGSSLESMRLVMQIIQNYGRRAYKEGESDATNTV